MSLRRKAIDWAMTQTPLQKEILFRVIKNNTFSTHDVLDICNLVKKEVGLISGAGFDYTHDFGSLTSKVDDGTKVVRLKRMYNLKEVNTLDDGMEVPFCHKGITIVYGENGAGKSGIAKVLKSICSARVRNPVLPNIYSNDANSVPSASIECFFNDDVHNIDWKADTAPELALSNIHVFDSKTADVQISNKNEISFIPSGGQIFELAINLIKAIKDKLGEELEQYSVPDIATAKLMGAIQDEFLTFYTNIRSNTDVNSIDLKLVWEKKDDVSLEEFEKLLKGADIENNQKLNVEVSKCQAAFNEISSFIKICKQIFSDEKIKGLEKSIADYISKGEALDVLGKKINTLEVLDGVGGPFWREMYEAARKYSEKLAYKDKKYPYIDAGSKCVLCNQKLDDIAIRRFLSFEEMMTDQIKKEFDELKKKIDEISEYIKAKLISSKDVAEAKVELLKDYITEKEKITILSFLKDAYEKALHLQQKLLDKSNGPINIKLEADVEEVMLEAINERIGKKINELKEILDPKKISDLKTQILKLKLRRELFSHKETFLNIVRINKKNSLLEKGRSLLNSAAISRSSNILISGIIKDSFLVNLKKEAHDLGASHIPISMNTSGGDGKVYFDIVLEKGKLPRKSKISDILSEGEQKIISIAAFLAEISISDSNHAIIFDDPVTSLDHKFKERIARRLVIESLKRQVIVFTHDISFLSLINDFGVELNATGGPLYIHRPGGKGTITTDSPWDTMGLKEMIHHLNLKNISLGKLQAENVNQYNEAAGEIYGLMRESWEKLIEDVLLNGTISRFSYGVKTMSLAGVSIEDPDYKTVFLGMKKCSRWMTGHKDSENIDSKRPTLAEIQSDIDAFKAYFELKKKNREQIEKQRKELVTAMPKPAMG